MVGKTFVYDPTIEPLRDYLRRPGCPRASKRRGASMSDRQHNPGQISTDMTTLRKRAEEQARTLEPTSLSTQTPETIQQMLHELRVRQIELEMQNEELRRAQAKIEAGRARYVDLYDLAPVAYCTLSEQGLILEANLTATTLLGMARGALVEQPISRFILKEDQDIYYLHCKKLFETGEAQECELRLVKPDGTHLWAHLTSTATQAEDGAPVCRMVLSDITERKRAEEALCRSEERFRFLVDYSHDLIWMLRADGFFSYVSPSWKATLGYEPSFMVEKGFQPFVHPDDVAECEQYMKRVLDAGNSLVGPHYRVKHADGTWRWHEGSITPVFAEDESFAYFVGVSRDITERKQAEQTLQESEERFRNLMENIDTVAVQGYGPDGITQYWNKASERLYGYNQQEAIGCNLLDLIIPPEMKDDVAKAIREMAESCQAIPSGELLLMHKDGSRVPVLSYHAIVKVPGREQELFCLDVDITERKRAEEALREQRDFSESLIDTAQAIILVLDTKGRIVRFNSYMEQLVGYDLDEVKGMDWFETFLTPEIDRTVKPLFEKIVADSHTSGNVNPIIAKDGRTILVEWHNKTLKDKNGRTVGILAIGQDITEREQAEKNLKMAHEKLLTILDSIDATVYVADRNTHEILFMNQKMVTVFGGNKTGGVCYSAFRNNSAPCECCTNDQLIDKDGNPGSVCIWHDKNPVTGRYFINHDRAIEWTDGRLVRMQIATDITELKRVEAQLHQAQKMESVGRLAGGVAHDFNNMLGVILGHTEMALEETDPASPLHPGLQSVQHAAERSAALTRQLLAFARKQTVAPKILDCNDAVSGMLNMVRRLIGEDIDLVWLPHSDLWPIKMDPSQLDQILANLCVNARDAIAGVGKVTIETENISFDEASCTQHPGLRPGEYVLLAVSDNGCGMDQDTLLHLFEPYFTTKELGKGTGLGLATVYGVVKQNNGFINVYSEPGQGTTIKTYLPRHQAKGAPLPDKEAIRPIAPGHETILLVEDEPAILSLTTMMLERGGYAVLAAGTPGEAIRLATEHAGDIHLLMTDVVMPEMNGRDLAKNILSIYSHLKCLFMSGYTANVIAHRGVLDEGVNFIQKPFSKGELAAKVREVLDRD